MNSFSPQDQKLLKILKDMEALGVEYPEDLLSARKSAFMEQLNASSPAEAEELTYSKKDLKVIDLLRRLRSVPENYPAVLWYPRRAAFIGQILWMNWVSLWTTLWSAVQARVPLPAGWSRGSFQKFIPASLMAAGFVLAVFVGMLFYENRGPLANILRPQHGIVKSVRMVAKDTREVRIICKPGYQPPLCLAGEFDLEDDLTYQGNGTARPAVAKDTAPGRGTIHLASYVNDGLYGPGASWISNSRNSWIKIDLGKVTAINTVKFGRDRLGEFNDGDPGRFVIAVALSDDVYANGNSSNDEREYKVVYDSQLTGFKGTISGAETVTAQFRPLSVRYIKITFQNKGTAIDEVEAFMVQPPELASNGHNTPRDTDSQSAVLLPTRTSLPVSTWTSIPVSTLTPLPTFTTVPTFTATLIPTFTSLPTFTATPLPTNTPPPTDTVTPVPPTSTRPPTDTATSVPPTSTPVPTDTPQPPPTDPPVPTATEVPPTAIPPLEIWPPGMSN